MNSLDAVLRVFSISTLLYLITPVFASARTCSEIGTAI